jgi:uncharacterized protein
MNSIRDFIIFLIIVLSVYFLSNFYIYRRTIQALALAGNQLLFFRIVFLLIILSYPIGRILEGYSKGLSINYIFILVGSIWMGMMLYLILSIFLIDILRLFNYFFAFFPESLKQNKANAGRVAFYAVASITLIVTAYGFFNARCTKIFDVDIVLDKLRKEKNPFTIVQVSDIHFGKIINQNRLFEIANEVNSLNPDIVVFTGDVVDDDSAVTDELVEPFSQIKAKYGKYFITGNHDYFGNIKDIKEKIAKSGVKILNNEYVIIDSSVVLLGLDYLYGRKSNKDQRSLNEILSGADRSLPVVLLKHVPDDLDLVADAGIDLQLSGHTHHGQLFPFNFITNWVYKVSSGLGRYKNLQIYVNRGVGFWGPPMRVGVPSEITKITLKANKKQ